MFNLFKVVVDLDISAFLRLPRFRVTPPSWNVFSLLGVLNLRLGRKSAK
jgi:hypothetical protein